MTARMPTSRGQIWLVLQDGARAVQAVRHQHTREGKCVIRLVLAPVKGELEPGKRLTLRIERSHVVYEVITRYTEEAVEDEILLVLPGKRPPFKIIKRRQFDEAVRVAAATSRSRLSKYIG